MQVLRQIIRPLLAAGLFVGAASGAAAQGTTGTITGRVVDQTTQTPVVGASVVVVGTTRGDVSRGEGTFTITGVAPGSVTLRATRIGYAPATQTVTVTAGATATVTVGLSAVATALEQVVVTATGEEQRVREQGNAISRIELPEARLAAVPNFSNAISAQAPGVQVLQSGGTTGTGSRVRIRGANSLSLSNEPLIIIDGVRVNSSASSSSIGTGGQTPSRLNDINPEDIESIEILKGPAASGLYGTQAANGVIQITTKRGAAGDPRWTAWVEAGTIVENNAYPANYGAYFTNSAGATRFGCDLMSVSFGDCVQDSVVSFNPLEVNSPFRDGRRGQYGLSVNGGTERLTYYVSGELEDETGIYRTNALDRINLRGNFRLGLSERLTATLTTGFLSSDQRLPQNDNNFLGYISNGIAGTALPDGGVDEDGYDPVGPRTIDQIDWNQESRRFISSLNGDWRPLSWLRVTGTAGLDLLNRYDQETLPVGAVRLDEDTEAGERTSNRLQFSTWTTNVSGIADYPITEALRGTTTLGFQYQRELSEGTFAFGAGLAAGTGNLGGATERFEVDESYADNRLAGGILTQQLAYNDRLFLTLGVRGDDNSAFGENFGTIFYPSAQLSWVASEEEFFPQPAWLSTVRLRGAFGQSGLRPGNRDAQTFFSPVPVRVGGSEEPGITFGGVGDPDLQPERTTEYEVGVDVGLFDDRLRVDAGYYDKRSEDALVSTRTAPSAGVSTTIFRNLGSIRNRGVEVQLVARPIDRPNFAWDFTINHSENRNEVEDLGDNPAIIFGLGGASQRHEEGFPAGAYFGETLDAFADTNDDGIVDELTYGDERYLGPSQPRRMTSLQTGFTFFNDLRVSTLLDYRGGYKQYNATEEFRCAIFTCRGLNDPTASLEEQARAMAAAEGIYAGYIEDADFVKLREVALTYTLPTRFASRLNATGVSLTVAGQNLGLWTDYTGLDPEINFAGQDNYSQGDFLSQPQVRRFTARVNVNF